MSVTTERPVTAGPEPRPPRRRPSFAALAVLFAAGWLVVGGVGAYVYVHRYWLYRGFPPNVTPAGIPVGHVREMHFFSRALHQRRMYLVYLPPGYRREVRRGHRFPVVYFLHAPPGRFDGYFKAGALDVAANVGISVGALRPMILVVPYGKTPAYDNDTEWANAKAGRFEDYVLDVVHNVDHRFATLPNRAHRGIAGLSEGGYGAVNIALHHLRMFSVVQSWSGYFVQTRTASFTGATARQIYDNSPALYLPRVAPKIRRLGLRAYLYQGTIDPINPRKIRRFALRLHRAGALVGYGFYPGGHDWGLWRRQIPHMLKLASTWFGEGVHDYSLSAPVQAVGHPAPKSVRDRLYRRLRARCFKRRLPAGERRPKLCRRLHLHPQPLPRYRHELRRALT